jgi:hypothetical protein
LPNDTFNEDEIHKTYDVFNSRIQKGFKDRQIGLIYAFSPIKHGFSCGNALWEAAFSDDLLFGYQKNFRIV